MKYTQVAADAFSKLQLNAGVLLKEFDPTSGTLDKTKIFGATGGGVNFTATPNYIDFGEDIDNVPTNTKELKQLDYYDVKMSGTFKTADTALGKALAAAADITPASGKITPRSVLSQDDFFDIWWVGDYSDVNVDGSGQSAQKAGYVAIKLINALSTGGFQIQSNDNGKGDFAFEFTGHYSLNDTTLVPYEVYISGEPETSNAQLSALSITGVSLSPSFAPSTRNYVGSTSAASGTITATAAESGATVEIFQEDNDISSGKVATWETGENVVSVIVTNGDARAAYTVTVTKE